MNNIIRSVEAKDAIRLLEIYNNYVKNSHCTFEEEPVLEQEMRERFLRHPNLPFLVLTVNDKIVSYAYAVPWKSRSAYRFSVESTIYVDSEECGKGYGRTLYLRLLEELEKLSIHSVIGGIALPNDVSIKLHESLGFEKVAQFKKVGFKFNKWIDVGYWQLLLK